MIKINLIPYKKKKKKPKPVPTFLMVSTLLLTFAVVSSVLYNIYFLKAKIAALEDRKKENGKKIAQLKEKIKEVQDFERLNKTFTERKNIIEQLRKKQNMPVKIIDEMSMRLTEGIWLSTMSIDDRNISLTGIGFSNPEIVTFVQNLKASAMFGEVYLHETKQSFIEGIEVFIFSISLQVKA